MRKPPTKTNTRRSPDITVYGVTQAELFRLTCAFCAIRDPTTRFNILATVEEWVEDQWGVH